MNIQREDLETIMVLVMVAVIFCYSVAFSLLWQQMEEGRECYKHLPSMAAQVHELNTVAKELVESIPDLSSQNAVIAYCHAVNRSKEPPVEVAAGSSDHTHSTDSIGGKDTEL